jgi:hypothetical protein
MSATGEVYDALNARGWAYSSKVEEECGEWGREEEAVNPFNVKSALSSKSVQAEMKDDRV